MDSSSEKEQLHDDHSDALIPNAKELPAFGTDRSTGDGRENMADSNRHAVTEFEAELRENDAEGTYHNGKKDEFSVERSDSHDEAEAVDSGAANGETESDIDAGDDSSRQGELSTPENNVPAEEHAEESSGTEPPSVSDDVASPVTGEEKPEQEKECETLDPSASEEEVAEPPEGDKKEEGSPSTVDDAGTGAKMEEMEDDWQDILGNGLLKKRVLKEGKGRDTRPEKGQIVTLRTAGRMEDGTGVDWNHGMEFIQGDMEVIPALDLTVALMEVGEVCKVVTDSKYAYGQYGKQDSNPPIPPNANLTYELELLAVRDGPNIYSMKDDERVSLGDKKRELGNDLFTRKDYSGAINCYQQALKFLGNSESQEVLEVKIKCWNNLAAAQLKIKAYQAAHNSCMEVLQVDEDNVKALFRRGKVLVAQGELAEALVFLKKASQLEPANKTIRSELQQIRRQRATQLQVEKDLYQRMVGGLGQEQKGKDNGSSYFSWPVLLGATAVAVGGILTALYMTRH